MDASRGVLLDWSEQLLAARLPRLTAAGPNDRFGPEEDDSDCHYVGRLLSGVILPVLPPGDVVAAGRVAACAHWPPAGPGRGP